jgi:indolepyruvate ferredoxin oxidoreductase alpha subunit
MRISNLASAGVTGGALIVLGEDYGEGASIMQGAHSRLRDESRRLWLLDPRPDLPTIVRLVERGFELSEASKHAGDADSLSDPRLPHARPVRRERQPPAGVLRRRMRCPPPRRSYDRIILPRRRPTARSAEKIERRWPAAVEFVVRHALNERYDGELDDVGIVLQGGSTTRCFVRSSGWASPNVFGASRVPFVRPQRDLPRWCRRSSRSSPPGKRALLVVEEGQTGVSRAVDPPAAAAGRARRPR